MPDPIDGYGEGCVSTTDAIQRGVWIRLAGDSPDAPAADVLLVPDGAHVNSAPTGKTSTDGPSVVTHQGTAADARPTVD
jgi:hypothetical protein